MTLVAGVEDTGQLPVLKLGQFGQVGPFVRENGSDLARCTPWEEPPVSSSSRTTTTTSPYTGVRREILGTFTTNTYTWTARDGNSAGQWQPLMRNAVNAILEATGYDPEQATFEDAGCTTIYLD